MTYGSLDYIVPDALLGLIWDLLTLSRRQVFCGCLECNLGRGLATGVTTRRTQRHDCHILCHLGKHSLYPTEAHAALFCLASSFLSSQQSSNQFRCVAQTS